MAFPTSSLTNNQVHKEGNRAFVYDSALGVWDQVRETDRTENKILSGEIGAEVTFPDNRTFSNKIASGDFTAVGIIDIQGCFTSTYKIYKLFLVGYSIGSTIGNANNYTEVGFLDTSNAHLTNQYYTKFHQYYGTDSNGAGGFHPDVWTANETHGISDQNDSHGFRIVNTWHQDSIDEGQFLEMTFMVPQDARKTHCMWNATWAEPTYVGSVYGMGVQNNNTAKGGIRIATSAGLLFTAQGHFALYGF